MPYNDQSLDATTPQQSVIDVVEKITKAVVAVLAISYALGMAVSNQYLIALGSSDFSSVRPKYVLTGFWVLLVMLLSSFPVLLPAMVCDRLDKKAALLAVLGLIFSGLVGGLFLLILHFDYRWLNEQPDVIKTATVLTGTTCICALLVIIGIRRLRRIQNIGSQIMGYVVVGVMLCSLLATVTFQISQHIYNHIPEAMGGGKAVLAFFILNEKGEDFWKQASPLMGNNTFIPNRIQFAKIIYQDDKQFIIEIEQPRPDHPNLNFSNKTLIVRRDLIDGVFVDSRGNRF
jgi:hypothetical protein